MPELTQDTLLLGLVWYVVFLFSTTLHEAAHAWTAWRLGDSTAYEGGQVTLNPLPHVRREVFGTVLVPLFSFALSGWMIGWASAPYDPMWAQRHPRRSAIMSAAGPLANLLLVVVAGVSIRAGMAAGVFAAPESVTFTVVTEAVAGVPAGLEAAAVLLSILFTLNLLLFAFNLIPFPPLDGSGVLPLVLPERAARRYQETLLAQPMLALAGLLVAWRFFGELFWPLLGLGLRMLYPEMIYG